MKNTRRVILALLTVAIILPTFNSCKKGEDDKLLPFSSRKFRLCNTWVLEKGKEITTSTWSGSVPVEWNYTTDSKQKNGGNTFYYSEEISFDKDHTFKVIIHDEESNSKAIQTGSWSWGSKDKELDLKAREYIVVRTHKVEYYFLNSGVLNEIDNWENSNCPIGIIEFKKLSKDELVVVEKGKSIYTEMGTENKYVVDSEKTYKVK